METQNNNNKKLTLGQKLFEMQTRLKTFDVSEESNKIDPKTRKSTYKYTPGYVIIEAVRELMDQYRVMLIPDIKIKELKPVEKDVFLGMPDGTYAKETKRDVVCSLDAKFTWLDPDTGETMGPLSSDAANMNDIDKSCASAHAFAKRYFLLDFFGITTHDQESEPDSNSNIINIQPSPLPASLQNKSLLGIPAPAPQFGQGGYPAPQQGGYAPIQQAPAQQPAAPAYTQAPQQQIPAPFDMNDPNILGAVNKLANYQKDTPTEKKMLNQILGGLSPYGYPVTDPVFIANIQEAAQARREGRLPNFK